MKGPVLVDDAPVPVGSPVVGSRVVAASVVAPELVALAPAVPVVEPVSPSVAELTVPGPVPLPSSPQPESSAAAVTYAKSCPKVPCLSFMQWALARTTVAKLTCALRGPLNPPCVRFPGHGRTLARNRSITPGAMDLLVPGLA